MARSVKYTIPFCANKFVVPSNSTKAGAVLRSLTTIGLPSKASIGLRYVSTNATCGWILNGNPAVAPVGILQEIKVEGGK
jgi:hypothetical protein